MKSFPDSISSAGHSIIAAGRGPSLRIASFPMCVNGLVFELLTLNTPTIALCQVNQIFPKVPLCGRHSQRLVLQSPQVKTNYKQHACGVYSEQGSRIQYPTHLDLGFVMVDNRTP